MALFPKLEDWFDLGPALGQGALGSVHRAVHRETGEVVAIKLSRAGVSEDLEARVQREAKLLLGINHPGLARLVGCYLDRTGKLALAYGLIEGTPLAELVPPGGLDLGRALAWADDLARALDALHRTGLVHRDLKPANVMVEAAGGLRIIDFGLARPEASGDTLTAMGSMLGTPHYMAPEQTAGGRTRKASDLYALGGVVHFLLTGRPPFDGDTEQVLRQHAAARPPRLTASRPELPAALDAVLERALAKSPPARFPSAEALVEALRAAAGPVPPPAPLALPAPGPAPTRSRSLALAGALVLALGALLVSDLLRRPERYRPAPGVSGQPPQAPAQPPSPGFAGPP